MTTPDWQLCTFSALDNDALYRLLQARQAVFVIEQHCLYDDIDGLDPVAWHLLGWQGAGAERVLAAYARILPPGINAAEPRIGRVLTSAASRGQGLGAALLEQALAATVQLFPGAAIRIAAQCHLQPFYRRFGFYPVSQPYDEDGILHIDMLRTGDPELAAPYLNER